MADVMSSWKTAGTKVTELGTTIKGHYDKQRPGDASTREDVSEAFKKLGSVLTDAVDAVRDAAKDPAIRGEVKDIGRSLGDALTATVDQVTGEVRHAFDRRKGQSAAQTATPTSAPTAAPTSAPTAGAPVDMPTVTPQSATPFVETMPADTPVEMPTVTPTPPTAAESPEEPKA